ncbi:translation initiation factor IF-3 [Advenella kashmirensis]|jgi:translation initiation factor IF-3|uniref:Translation initiation factor IF-3 n=1 Tax=Advenella incenata TaxID=267800 RepID=A0A4Q7VV23_9BURK|nr:translation initiation factor IF-3 [Advenella incenata]RZU00433.1 translation initiation factor 3 (bIF-3) [Advenella incenata]
MTLQHVRTFQRSLLISGDLNIATEKTNRINAEIRIPEVRLIGVDGEQLGIVKTVEALRLAEQEGVDLVEIAPNAEPPVCRIMDYGKFKYQEQKRQQEAKAKQKIIQVKEVKFRPATDEGDYQVKLRNLKRFIEDGDKAKVTLRFRGREMAHQELGMRVLERVRDDMAELVQVEAMPKLEGRQMVMVLAPKRKAVPAGKADDK